MLFIFDDDGPQVTPCKRQCALCTVMRRLRRPLEPTCCGWSRLLRPLARPSSLPPELLGLAGSTRRLMTCSLLQPVGARRPGSFRQLGRAGPAEFPGPIKFPRPGCPAAAGTGSAGPRVWPSLHNTKDFFLFSIKVSFIFHLF